MPRKKRPQFDKSKAILMGVIAGLIGILVTLIVAQSAVSRNVVNGYSDELQVSLGMMQYAVADGKATKRNDETVTSLKAFLQSLVERDNAQDCKSYYNVFAVSNDETQVRVRYGCNYPAGSMFVVNDNGAWRTISPTNHFDNFDIPECSYLNENQIDKAIAPVCVDGLSEPGPDTYSVRE